MTSKPTSRWGFLQQAVASVESRLDNILAEGEEPPRRIATPAQQPSNPGSKRTSFDVSRSSNNASPSNDRLQERLARAMAKKNPSRTESPVPAQGEGPALPESEDVTSARGSLDSAKDSHVDSQPTAEETTALPPPTEILKQPEAEEQGKTGEEEPSAPGQAQGDSPAPVSSSLGVPESGSARVSSDLDYSSQSRPSSRLSMDVAAPEATAGKPDGSMASGPALDEINAYIEKIDALQSKLQYLSKEAAQAARQAAASADSGSVEKRLSEKDEKIALLLEEGQKLSRTEMMHLTTIKKLRAQLATNNKESEAARAKFEKVDRSLRILEDRAKKAESANREAEQNLAESRANSKDTEALRKERDALNATVADIKSQLSRANARADAAESKATADQLDKERKRAAGLQDDLTSVKVERELAEEKLQREIRDLKASLEREREQSKTMENEMLNEQAMLEGKLEAYRVRAEEASSADQGHAHAKLLRQIETLQNQYATASQNWQGIESSLLGRIANLEKERDEVVARDTDLRKKLRDATLKSKNAQRELEDAQKKYSDADRLLADADSETQRLTRRAEQLEADLAKALKAIDEQKAASETEFQRRLEEAKARWTTTLNFQRTDSPGTSLRKQSNMGMDINYLMSPSEYTRPTSRRSSTMHSLDPHSSGTPPHQSAASFRGATNGSIAEMQSPTFAEQEEYFANVPPTPVSQSHASRNMPDIISTSTVGVGPSVQLVERMSANVRRLESEKAASKDELARITAQRDESRAEVVSLMREAEEKRKFEERLKTLEAAHGELKQRHQTTLELLGEKSEQVEELKADIVDVKTMYRQLADTMK